MRDITERVKKTIIREAEEQLAAIIRLEAQARRAKGIGEARTTMCKARAAANRYNELIRELSTWQKNMLELDPADDTRTPKTLQRGIS